VSAPTELDELASACIFPSFPGDTPPDWIKRFLAGGGGGVVLFAYNVPARDRLGSLCAALRTERGDVLLAIDEEGGDVTRLEWQTGSSYPGGAALGAVDDPEMTEAVAASIAAELAAVGVNWNLAPVADVNVPANPVIGTRAFGSDPTLVAKHVAAFVRGTQSRRVAACAKHWPGHGATEQDSHLELPVVTGEVAAGLAPFRAAIADDVRTIMTAHVRVPALDDAPATLSRAIVQGLLRDELGYDGVVLADALEMKAVSETVGIERSAVRALQAGVDALCVGHDLGEAAVEQIRAALVEHVPEARLREAAGRIAALAAWARPIAGGVDRQRGLDAARRALVVDGDVGFSATPAVVELRPRANIAAGEAEHSLAAIVVREGEPVPAADVFVVRDAHRHPWMREAADVPGAVVIETGLPVWRPLRSRGYVATNGGSRASYAVVRELLALAVPA
jgi:beta-N-acetylhexosaminidase